MTRYKRTRIVSQDQKTGEFAYADQLIRDGYYPNLMVLPHNYEPPQPVGESLRLPLELLFNPSPQNIHDELVMVIVNQLQDDGSAVLLPVSTGSVGYVIYSVKQNVTGVSSTGTIGQVTGNIIQYIQSGSSSVSTVGVTHPTASYYVIGVSSIGYIGDGINQIVAGVVNVDIDGISSVGSVGAVLNGSGWGQGGGWGSNGWGIG